jgi:hypothetical protein
VIGHARRDWALLHSQLISVLSPGCPGGPAHPARDVVLRPGWCVMQSPFLVGGMAAVREAGGNRFVFFGGLADSTGQRNTGWILGL